MNNLFNTRETDKTELPKLFSNLAITFLLALVIINSPVKIAVFALAIVIGMLVSNYYRSDLLLPKLLVLILIGHIKYIYNKSSDIIKSCYLISQQLIVEVSSTAKNAPLPSNTFLAAFESLCSYFTTPSDSIGMTNSNR